MCMFCQKNFHSPKTRCSHVTFSNFSWITPCFEAYILSEDVNSVKPNVYIMGHKSQQNALFFRFFTKKPLIPCPYFVKKSQYSKKYIALMPLFYHQKTFISKNTVISCHFFFQNSHEKPSAVMPIFGRKTSILSKLYYWP